MEDYPGKYDPSSIFKSPDEAAIWLPASGKNVDIDNGQYDLTDKVVYTVVTGKAATQQGGLAFAFRCSKAGAPSRIRLKYKCGTGASVLFEVIDTTGASAGSSSPGTSTSLANLDKSDASGTFAKDGIMYVLVKASVDDTETVNIATLEVDW